MIRRHTGDVVVQTRASRTTRVLLSTAGVFFVVALGIALYYRGLSMAGYDRNGALLRDQKLEARVTQLRAENHTLRQSLAIATRSVQMDRVEYRDLHASLQHSAADIAHLQERVDLYRAILAPANPLQGITIERLDIRPLINRRYRYSLILLQPLETKGTALGRLRLRIAGTTAGGPATEVLAPARVDKAVPVNFKYFQDIEGTLDLPAGFVPTGVEVDVRTQGHLIQKTFPWPRAG